MGNKNSKLTEKDDIVETISLVDDEIENHELDTNLSNAQLQVKEMEKEVDKLKFEKTITISSNDEFSNSNYDGSPNLKQVDDEEIYHLEDNELTEKNDRKIELIKDLVINLGNYLK